MPHTVLPAVREIDPAEVDIRRRLFRPLAPLGFELPGLAAILDQVGEAATPAPLCSVAVLIGGRRCWLELPDTLIGILVDLVQPALSIAALDGEMLALMLELALLRPIEALEQRLGQEIRLVEVRDEVPPAAARLRLAARLTLGGSHFATALALPRETARLVAERLDGPTLDAARFGLTVELACEIGRTSVALAALKRLGPGDVIMPNEALRPPGRVVLTLAERWQASGTLTGRELTLKSGLQPVASHEEESAMSDEDPSATLGRTFDDLPIRLVFEVGRIEMPLAELSALGPGQVLLLPGEPAAPIGILANGRRIGSGELVLIGGQVGVRVVGLGVHG